MARPSTTEPATLFGAWLKEEYERRGLTQTLVAERSGFRQSTINGYVSGLRVPDQSKIRAIAHALADGKDAAFQTIFHAGLKAAGYALPQENDGRVQMSDYGITEAPGWEALSDEHRRLVGETVRATASAAASSMIRIMGGAFLDVDDDGNPLADKE